MAGLSSAHGHPLSDALEDWTFPEAEVRFGEHRELRQTLGLCATTRPSIAQVGEAVRRLRGSSFI